MTIVFTIYVIEIKNLFGIGEEINCRFGFPYTTERAWGAALRGRADVHRMKQLYCTLRSGNIGISSYKSSHTFLM